MTTATTEVQLNTKWPPHRYLHVQVVPPKPDDQIRDVAIKIAHAIAKRDFCCDEGTEVIEVSDVLVSPTKMLAACSPLEGFSGWQIFAGEVPDRTDLPSVRHFTG